MIIKRLFLLCCFLSLFAGFLPAQEATENQLEIENSEEPAVTEDLIAESETQPEEEKPLSPEMRRVDLEIRTSTLPELAAWCRSLNLPEAGTRADLAKRLRDNFELPEPKTDADENIKIITIESAQTTEYFKIEVIDEDYARLKGEVSLTLREKDAVHTIKANEILFNRTRNILTASGGVKYERVKDDTTETFSGENITVNIDDWSSIFLDGNSVRKFQNETSAYRFTGTVITRNNDEDVMIIKDARVSNADTEEAYWSISASKLMLLPGSDFFIFNAVLKVGEIPVLYLPVFYFPADDLIFHPVVGYKSREGGFIQTTTYILGRPTSDKEDSNSLTRILGSAADMDKERQGLFLRSTGKRTQNTNEISLKAMADYYTNLGAYLGIDFSIPYKVGILNNFNLAMGLGFTRTVTRLSNGSFTPYEPNYDGSSDWNSSNFLSFSVPFRYKLDTRSSISGTYGQFSWEFQYYSDPYVDRDFKKRAESMDWLNMIQQGVEDDSATSNDELGTYNWNISGSITPSIKFLSPYISNISINPVSTTMLFTRIRDINKNNIYNPGQYFFAPDKYTIYSISSSISGNPLSINRGNQSGSEVKRTEPEDILKDIGVPRSPWPKDEEAAGKNISDDVLTIPALSQSFDLPKTGNNRFNINYTISPSSSTELQFRSGYNNWQTYEDVNWSEVQSILSTVRINSTVTFSMDHTNSLYTNTVTFTTTGNWRDFGYLNEEAEKYLDSNGDSDPNKVAEERRSVYSYTNYSSSYAYNGTLRPLNQNPIFGQSQLQYVLGGTLVKSKKHTGRDGPELSPLWGSWVNEKSGEDILGVNSHKLTFNLAANIMDKQQNFTLSAFLPPLDGLISTNATFRAWISETTAGIVFRKPEIYENSPNSVWKKDPLTLTETLRFGDFGRFYYEMAIAPEQNNDITNIESTLNLGKQNSWNFNTGFKARKETKWEFIPDPNIGGKWERQGDPVLTPTMLSFAYWYRLSNIALFKNRINLTTYINTGLSFNLQQYTSSNFIFSFEFDMLISGFLKLKLNMNAKNDVIWRYFKNIPGMEKYTFMYPNGPQNNPITDLLDSFNFADEAKRRRSGFKMQGFSFSATHFLGDWTADLKIDMKPDRQSGNEKFEISTDISFVVTWTAIPEVKKDIKYEQKFDKWIIQ